MKSLIKPLVILALGLLAPLSPVLGLDRLYLPVGAEHGCITGWDQRYPGVPSWVRETVYQETFNRKYVKLAPGESYVLAEIEGPGVVNRIFFTVPIKTPRHNLRAMVLRIYWDGEENPSVATPLGDFFGAPFGKYVEYDSQAMSMQGGGMVCRFHMPFAKSARIEIENGWPDHEAVVFFGINWYEMERLPKDALYFHALWRRENPTTPGEPFLVADLKGRGNYVGVQLFFQNRSFFLFKDFNSLMQPEGFGMGNLEGWEEMFIDGRLAQHGTGTEEYFNAGAYFATGSYSGIYEGVHVRSYLTGRTSTYRFHLADPVPFRQEFRMVWHHGPLDVVNSDYAAVAYWYQTEPHVAHELPGLEERIPSETRTHAAQALAIAPLVFGNKLVNRLMVE